MRGCERPLPERTRALAAQGGSDLTAVRAGDARWVRRCGRCCRACSRTRCRRARRRTAARTARRHGRAPLRVHQRTILMLRGCVQPSMMPNIDRAAARVLDSGGHPDRLRGRHRLLRRSAHPSQRSRTAASRTCAATSMPGGRSSPRAMCKRSSPPLRPVVSPSRSTAHALSGDAAYADKAARISALARDLSELLPQLLPALQGRTAAAVGRGGWPFTRPARCSTARN